jgi:hypothetical protein
MKKLLLFLTAAFLLSSCATILTGSKRSVLFESNPSGAKIYVNGIEKGKTPSQIKVTADDRVDFKLEGFSERVVVMDSKFNLVAILNGFSLIGWGVDAISGSLSRVDTKYVKVDLEKANPNKQIAKYLEKGKVRDVKINTSERTIVTTIILN